MKRLQIGGNSARGFTAVIPFTNAVYKSQSDRPCRCRRCVTKEGQRARYRKKGAAARGRDKGKERKKESSTTTKITGGQKEQQIWYRRVRIGRNRARRRSSQKDRELRKIHAND